MISELNMLALLSVFFYMYYEYKLNPKQNSDKKNPLES